MWVSEWVNYQDRESPSELKNKNICLAAKPEKLWIASTLGYFSSYFKIHEILRMVMIGNQTAHQQKNISPVTREEVSHQ